MSILTRKTILEEVENKRIVIDDFSEDRVGPNSINLRLFHRLCFYQHQELDMAENNPMDDVLIPEEGLWLKPNTLYLGKTAERTYTPHHIPMIEGRSSVGRLGLFVHVTAGFGDIGFNGYWTLEIMCTQPIRIYPNVEICQIYFHEPTGDYGGGKGVYQGKYQDNHGIQGSKMYEEFEQDAKGKVRCYKW